MNTTSEQEKKRSPLTGQGAPSKPLTPDQKFKDHAEKLFFSHPDVYVDVINGTFFRGRRVITEDMLEQMATDYPFLERIRHSESFRDLARLVRCRDGSCAGIFCIENQTVLRPAILARIMLYDALTYQVELKDRERYLCPDGKKVAPNTTLILYFSEEAGKDFLRLSDLVGQGILPNACFNNYGVRVLDVPRLSDRQIRRYHSDFRAVATALAHPNDMDRLRRMRFSIRHVQDFGNLRGGEQVSGCKREV